MAKSDVETRRAVASVTAIMSVEDNFVNQLFGGLNLMRIPKRVGKVTVFMRFPVESR